MQWLGVPPIHLAVAHATDVRMVLPPELALATYAEPGEAVGGARRSLLATGNCLAATPLEPVAVAASLHAARLSFSAYRLSKSQWLCNAGVARSPAYQWWEA